MTSWRGSRRASSTRFRASTAWRSTSPPSLRRRSSGNSPRLAPAVPPLEVPGHGPHEVAALIPAGARPLFEVKVAAGGIAGLAHDADLLARVHAIADVKRRRVGEVHVHVVVAGPLAVDHDVVAGAAGLVGAVLHV